MSRVSGWLIATALFLVVTVVLSPAWTTPAAAQESASYCMDRVTVAAGAARAVSPSYEISLTFGEEGPAGSA